MNLLGFITHVFLKEGLTRAFIMILSKGNFPQLIVRRLKIITSLPSKPFFGAAYQDLVLQWSKEMILLNRQRLNAKQMYGYGNMEEIPAFVLWIQTSQIEE